jgi:hypothetical protein
VQAVQLQPDVLVPRVAPFHYISLIGCVNVTCVRKKTSEQCFANASPLQLRIVMAFGHTSMFMMMEAFGRCRKPSKSMNQCQNMRVASTWQGLHRLPDGTMRLAGYVKMSDGVRTAANDLIGYG